MTASDFDTLARRIAATGLCVRGAFQVEADDDVPPAPGGDNGRTLILIGNTGSSLWTVFGESPEYRDGQPHPLDRWSERVITDLGRELDARPVFPFKGPPYHPFQKWAQRAEAVFPSPMGILINPEYGLWHAYRGALIFDRCLDGLPARDDADSPCLSCTGQPCLHSCPVNAYTSTGFDARACASHLAGANTCTDEGCRARNACPAGKPVQDVRDQHRFHLAAFLRARTNEGSGQAS
jgi:hypothetical protein